MSIVDAQTARAMSQKVKRAMPTVQANFYTIHPLLKIAQDRNLIRWKGSHTKEEWFIRKTKTASTWGGGELGIRKFEEVDPANQVELPFCWIEETFGVSDKTMEANRHAGSHKIYDSLAENVELAVQAMYDRVAPDIYNGNTSGDGDGITPVGIIHAVGNCYETTNNVTVTAAKTYATKTLTSAGISAFNQNRTTMGWSDLQWAPTCLDIGEVPNAAGNQKWSEDCLLALAFMAEEMSVTAKASGTGQVQKPDLALMGYAPYHAIKAKLLASQAGYNIPVGNQSLSLAGWPNIQVDTLLVIKDNDVPADSGSVARVLVMDSKQFRIATTHTKEEGLIKREFDPKNIMIQGVVGFFRANLYWRMNSPTAIGCITGCNA
jgi:hypothetical protein